METGLDGQVALVVGGGSGIGQATAMQFAREGAAVVVAGRRLAPLEQVVREVEDLGGTAMAYQTDVSVPHEVVGVLQATVDRFGSVHVVANCAAVVDRVENMLTGGVDDFDHVINVNLRGAWLLIRAAARAMIAAGEPGAMVTVSSINALRPGTVDYSTSKAGVEGLTRAAANVLGQHGIRVNAVRSGFIDTAMLRYAWDVPADIPFPSVQVMSPTCRLAESANRPSRPRRSFGCAHKQPHTSRAPVWMSMAEHWRTRRQVELHKRAAARSSA